MLEVGAEGWHRDGHAAQQYLRSRGIPGLRKDGLDPFRVEGPVQQHAVTAGRPGVYTRGKLREKGAAFRLACERLAFLLRPGQAHRVVPYDQRRILRQRTTCIVKRKLDVGLAKNRQLDSEQFAHVLGERPRRIDERVACNGLRALAARHLHAAHAPAAGVDTLHAPLSRAFSSMYMPSCCALNQPQRRACTTAQVVSLRYGKCRRMSEGSQIRSAPSGRSSKPLLGAGT